MAEEQTISVGGRKLPLRPLLFIGGGLILLLLLFNQRKPVEKAEELPPDDSGLAQFPTTGGGFAPGTEADSGMASIIRLLIENERANRAAEYSAIERRLQGLESPATTVTPTTGGSGAAGGGMPAARPAPLGRLNTRPPPGPGDANYNPPRGVAAGLSALSFASSDLTSEQVRQLGAGPEGWRNPNSAEFYTPEAQARRAATVNTTATSGGANNEPLNVWGVGAGGIQTNQTEAQRLRAAQMMGAA